MTLTKDLGLDYLFKLVVNDIYNDLLFVFYFFKVLHSVIKTNLPRIKSKNK